MTARECCHSDRFLITLTCKAIEMQPHATALIAPATLRHKTNAARVKGNTFALRSFPFLPFVNYYSCSDTVIKVFPWVVPSIDLVYVYFD